MMTRISPLLWMMGMLMAPHALALMGNLAGVHQGMFFVLLVVAAGIYWINAQSISRLRQAVKPFSISAQRPLLALIQLSSRWLTAMALSTVLLVTAGFSFNETFLHWFPNFAFAYILLGVIWVVQLWGPNAVRGLQLISLSVVLLGLTVLIVMGLLGRSASAVEHSTIESVIRIDKIFTMLLLFVGFDLVLKQRSYSTLSPMRTMIIGLSITALVWGLWGWLSLLYVPAGKLSDSFIPHIIAARSMGADTGRRIMGVVVIFGSVAAVNALLASLSHATPPFVSRLLKVCNKNIDLIQRPATWSVISTAIIGAMMAGGMAGSDEIDIYVRAGLILWIIYYAAIHLVVITELRLNPKLPAWPGQVLPALGGSTMGIGAGALILLDPHSVYLMKIILCIATIIGLLLILIIWRERNAAAKRQLQCKTRI